MGIRKNIYFKNDKVISKLDSLKNREKSYYVEQCILKDLTVGDTINATKHDIDTVNQSVLELTEALYTLISIIGDRRTP